MTPARATRSRITLLAATAIAAVLLSGCESTGGLQEPVIENVTSSSGDPSDQRNRVRIRTELGSLYYSLGNMAVAPEELRLAVAADPTYALASSMLGTIHMELLEPKLAEQNFERALQLSLTDSEINHRYGWFLCQAGREANSQKFFQHSIRNPLNLAPWRSSSAVGVYSMRKGLFKEAEGFFQASLRQDRNDGTSLYNLGLLRYQQGSMKEARMLVSRPSKLEEPSAESLWLALRIARKLGERNAEASLGNQPGRRFPASREYQAATREI
ncbi:MAG: type IV pilus biogenesis/stability protein PilW [Proteobacteria bacterium]|nr:type IV pilus biogenesis/stability protein PilW [Pseudomonadota bacterium]